MDSDSKVNSLMSEERNVETIGTKLFDNVYADTSVRLKDGKTDKLNKRALLPCSEQNILSDILWRPVVLRTT